MQTADTKAREVARNQALSLNQGKGNSERCRIISLGFTRAEFSDQLEKNPWDLGLGRRLVQESLLILKNDLHHAQES